MKIRYVYTVTRPVDNPDLETALHRFRAIKDEAEEYLYGSAGIDERVDVRLEFSDDGGKTWNAVNDVK